MPDTQKKPVPKIDDYAASAFKEFGFKEPFPDELASLYGRVKRLSDSLAPRRMPAEVLALVAVLAVDRIKGRDG